MSHPSSTSSTTVQPTKNCYCGRVVVIRTSWTDANPGRRFLGCEAYGRVGNGCGYFEWHDPPMCQRSINIIPGLLRRIKKFEIDRQGMNKKMRLIALVAIVAIAVAIMALLCLAFALVGGAGKNGGKLCAC